MLDKVQHTDHYVDDILTHTDEWYKHLQELRVLFERIRAAHVTIRPKKCRIGYETIGFVGHTIGRGKVCMEDDKVEKIEQAERPRTKKQVRAFLGLTGYYRKFIQNYAEIATPLTDLTKKGNPEKVVWGRQRRMLSRD